MRQHCCGNLVALSVFSFVGTPNISGLFHFRNKCFLHIQTGKIVAEIFCAMFLQCFLICWGLYSLISWRGAIVHKAKFEWQSLENNLSVSRLLCLGVYLWQKYELYELATSPKEVDSYSLYIVSCTRDLHETKQDGLLNLQSTKTSINTAEIKVILGKRHAITQTHFCIFFSQQGFRTFNQLYPHYQSNRWQ